jgi:hypothetical protein
MSQQYDNTNSGLLSRNDRKEKDSHPDFKGQISVEGKDYWLSGWIKERRDGTGKFFSLSVKPKDAQQPAAAPANAGASFREELNDDIPF